VTETFHFGLPGIGEGAMINQVPYTGKLSLFIRSADLVLQFVTDIKMVGNRTLSRALLLCQSDSCHPLTLLHHHTGLMVNPE